jgi:phospholipase/carboxylesterase
VPRFFDREGRVTEGRVNERRDPDREARRESLAARLRPILAAISRRLLAARRMLAIIAIVAVAIASSLALAVALLRARSRAVVWDAATAEHREGRLASRPHAPSRPSTAEGSIPLELGGCGLGSMGHELRMLGCRDGVLYVPRRVDDRPFGLLLLLHGGYSAPDGMVSRFIGEADRRGLLLLAPASRAHTWDVILSENRFGSDVAFIDRALAETIDQHLVDPDRVSIVGNSDGGSYALSLGLANGDLFRDVIAFSPGGNVAAPRAGNPRLFISHGRDDEVLPIDECSRVVVAELREAGLDVTYEEFDGGHAIPPEIFAKALGWLAAR